MSSSYLDAKYIRKQIQVGGDELYNLYLYLAVYTISPKDLERALQKIESVASGIGITLRKGSFRQKDIFRSTLPFNNIDKNTSKFAKRNVLTSRFNQYISFFIKRIM